jgi:cytochrome c oxidase subunit 2
MNEFLRRMLFLPEQGSVYSYDVDRLHYFVILTTIFASTGVGLTAIAFFVKYRRRHEGQRTPHVESGFISESLFVGIPLSFFLVWFGLGYRDYVTLSTPPPNAMDVYVMAKQWMWKFAYPEGPNAVGSLRVPMGRPVRLLITSRDVIHSFYVPAFRIKRDALPGRYTEIWFEAQKEGRFEVFCAEYCGAGHSVMRAEVVVMKPQDFDDWIREQRRGIERAQDQAATILEKPPESSSMLAQGQKLAGVAGCLSATPSTAHSTSGRPGSISIESTRS